MENSQDCSLANPSRCWKFKMNSVHKVHSSVMKQEASGGPVKPERQVRAAMENAKVSLEVEIGS